MAAALTLTHYGNGEIVGMPESTMHTPMRLLILSTARKPERRLIAVSQRILRVWFVLPKY